MVTGYRFTEDEFIFLAYFYQCTTGSSVVCL